MATFNLNTAELERVKLTKEQQKHIVDIYKNAAKSVAKKAKTLPKTPSAPLYEEHLKNLQKELEKELKKAEMSLKGEIEGNMKSAAQAVVNDNSKFVDKLGLGIKGAYSFVPADIVKSVASGQLYEGKWSLSRALWKNHMKTQYNINAVVAQGIAENKSAYDIAKDLEKYLNPEARKDWDWSKVYPGAAKRVDYNAQRLARTMVSHAYQQAFVRTTKNNPFVEDYVWLSAGGNRTCEVCMERDGKHFPKDSLPLDHPNGMCTFEAYIPQSMTEIADRLADWVEGKADPSLDKWIEGMGGIASEVKDNVQSGTNVQRIPSSKEWISLFERQTTSSMLEMEESAFERFTEAEKASLREYTGSSYKEMNGWLRTAAKRGKEAADNKHGDWYAGDIQRCQSALKKTALEKDLILRRGTDLGDLAGFLDGDFFDNKSILEGMSAKSLNKLFQGKVGQYAGFTSTSSDWNKGFGGDVEIVFYAPKGTQASSIMSISTFGTSEGETLLNAGTTVRINKIEESDGHRNSVIRVFMEILVKNQK